MARITQLQLFGIGLGEEQLFGPEVLRRYLQQHEGTPIPDHADHAHRLHRWLAALRTTTATERSLKTKFLSEIFGVVLGYTTYPIPRGTTASLYPEPPTHVTGFRRPPDALLGRFTDSDCVFTTAVELKTPGIDLDLPQTGHRNETPVGQGFEYGRNILGVRWVIVSDMQVIRLYSIESQWAFEEIAFAHCVDENGKPTDQFRRLHFLLHHDYLVSGHDSSQVALLHAKSTERRFEIRDSFYKAYTAIRSDLFSALEAATAAFQPIPSRDDLLQATQRLLDRLLFIFYCEYHPQQFIAKGTLARTTSAASSLPGPSSTKVYEALKALFREVDAGSSPGSGVQIAAYNGELFKDHPIVDHVQLPDALHRKTYQFEEKNGLVRRVEGVWGLHIFDFWTELNEYVLGHIFEASLSDLQLLGTDDTALAAARLGQRKKGGIYYTTSVLSEFLSESSIRSILAEAAPIAGDDPGSLRNALEKRLATLLRLRTIDFACGSGVFVVSVYKELLQEFVRLRTWLDALNPAGKEEGFPFEAALQSVEQFSVLRDCVFGVDLLPQAVEIAKLALWLRSARKNERVLDLSRNLVAGDSLDTGRVLADLKAGDGTFDLVIGNPPWGAAVDRSSYSEALAQLGLTGDGNDWDSWELFVVLSLKALREGGRLALVLPDSFLYPDKARIRRILFGLATPEKLHVLGPDWFGPDVRMGTVVLQARRGPLDLDANILSILLSGNLRESAIRGATPLTQIEAQRGRLLPIARVVRSDTLELEVFRGTKDDEIIEQMIAKSRSLATLCSHARGEEINKAGLMWICPSCLAPSVPGRKSKGRGYENKNCPLCRHVLSEKTVDSIELVTSTRPTAGEWITFIDGDDVNRRYQKVKPKKWMRMDLSGWPLKPPGVYSAPKILIRQAGVGLVAILDETESRCPQSVYIYRLKSEEIEAGYRHEFVLGTLLSRTMAYMVFKRFGEVDPDKAHAKLTHQRLADLPVPAVDFTDRNQRRLHDSIVGNVSELLNGARLGGQQDRAVDQSLRELWGISADDGAYINGEFYDLPDGQIMRELFPDGRPRPIPSAVPVIGLGQR